MKIIEPGKSKGGVGDPYIVLFSAENKGRFFFRAKSTIFQISRPDARIDAKLGVEVYFTKKT